VHEVQISAPKEGIGRGLVTQAGRREGEKIIDLPCLWFDSIDTLNNFLRAPGNSGWSNKVIVVSGVMKNGTPQDIYAVLVGAGQYINHFAGIKRAPNAKIIFDHKIGLSHGALYVIASNRNGTGIAAGVEILLNYGLSYDLATGDESTLDQPAKKFRGVLDAIFEQQRGQEQAATAGSSTDGPEEEATKKQEETAKKKQEEAKKKEEEAKKKQEEEAHQKTEEAAKAKAKAKACAGSESGPPAESAPGAASGSSSSIALEIGSLTAPAAKVILNGGKLQIDSLSTGNKKLPPGALLASWAAGDVKKCDTAGDVPYKMTPQTRVYARGPKKVMALNKLIKEHPEAKGLWGYQHFNSVGVLPKQLVEEKTRAFLCHDRNSPLPRVVAAANVAKSFEVVFMIKFDEAKKELQPVGVALVTTAQIILKPGTNTME